MGGFFMHILFTSLISVVFVFALGTGSDFSIAMEVVCSYTQRTFHLIISAEHLRLN